jgi:hypothetical protein
MSAALFSLSLEQDIIGAIMENKIAFDTVSGIINDSDFYDLRHASIFRAVAYLSKHNQPHDVLSVMHHMAKHDRLAHVGGEEYLSDITRNTAYRGESSIEARAMQVRKLSAGRKLIAACHSIIEMVEHPNEAAALEDTINIAESTIMAIRDGQARENDMGPKKIKEVLSRTVEILGNRENSAGDLHVHGTGETPARVACVAGRHARRGLGGRFMSWLDDALRALLSVYDYAAGRSERERIAAARARAVYRVTLAEQRAAAERERLRELQEAEALYNAVEADARRAAETGREP